MSTRIGTVKSGWSGQGFVPVAAFALIVVVTMVAIGTAMLGSPGAEQAPARPETAVEVSVRGTAANTPSEIRREAAGGVTAVGSFGGTVNTPSELSGGGWAATADAIAAFEAAERYDRHQRI